MTSAATDRSRAAAVARALRVGLTVCAGFLVVFGVTGITLTAGARWLTTAIPVAALAVGIILAVVGVVMLTGRSIPVRLPTVARAGNGTGTTGATALFGISYAVASLSCTLPVFLVVVGGAGTQASLTAGVATFATYAIGMVLPLLAVAVALAVGKDAVVTRVRGMARYTTRAPAACSWSPAATSSFYWATVLVPSGEVGDPVLEQHAGADTGGDRQVHHGGAHAGAAEVDGKRPAGLSHRGVPAGGASRRGRR